MTDHVDIPAPRSEMKESADRTVTFVLVMLQAIGSMFAVILTFFDSMSVGPCVETCDYDLKWFAFALTPTTALTAFVAVVIAVGVLRAVRPQRLTWWIPAVGISVVLTALIISVLSADVAMAV